MKRTVIIADKHPVFRRGVREILKKISGLEIVDEVSDGSEACESIISKRPDLAILGLETPGLNGIELAKKITQLKLPTRFIFVGLRKDNYFFAQAMQAGVSAFISKDIAIRELVSCVQKTLRGEKYILHGAEKAPPKKQKENFSPAFKKLSATEQVVLKLIAQNRTSSEIAKLLLISPNTVDNHRSHIVKKLGIKGKNSLLKFALQQKHLQ
jgi:DNA-binding NarL/FixJ family response regulator